MVHLENDNEYEPPVTMSRATGAILRVAAYRRTKYLPTEVLAAAQLLFAWEQAAEQHGITLKDLSVANVRLPASALDLIRARTRPPSTP